MKALTEEERAVRAIEVRESFIADLRGLLRETDAVGSRDLAALRIRHVLEARDRVTLRAAVMGLAEASALWVLALDLSGSVGWDEPTEEVA